MLLYSCVKRIVKTEKMEVVNNTGEKIYMSTTSTLLMGNAHTLVRYIRKIKSTTHFFLNDATFKILQIDGIYKMGCLPQEDQKNIVRSK